MHACIINIDMEPNRECPRFERCSVNNCPLTVKYPDWYICPDDVERRCTLGKARRVLIASKHHGVLKHEGKTLGEKRAERAWSARSSEEREKIVESLKKSR